MINKVILGLGAAVIAALVVPSNAVAQNMAMMAPEGHEATIQGTVIDISCKFRHGLTGADHRMCAQVCADRGIPLAILGNDGTLYLAVSAGMPGDSQNERLREFAEQEVTVQGTVYEAGGASAIQIESIRRS